MKNFTINIVALGNERNSVFAAQAAGTISKRPVFSGRAQAQPIEVALNALLTSLDELGGFLSENDIVDARIHLPGQKMESWLPKGSSNPQVNTKVRDRIIELSRSGVGVSIVSAPAPEKSLLDRVTLALNLGM